MHKSLYSQAYGEKQMRKVPAQYIRLLDSWMALNKKDHFLELGSGSGAILHHVIKKAKTVTGIELNPYVASRSLESDHVVIGSATDIPVKDATITKSLSIHVIEHISDVARVFQELERVSLPGALSLQIFPSPYLVRQEGALVDALRVTKNPFKAWKITSDLHVHKLDPEKLKEHLTGTSWKILRVEKPFVPREMGFSWAVLLEKKKGLLN